MRPLRARLPAVATPPVWTLAELESVAAQVDALASTLARQARAIRTLQARLRRMLATARRAAALREEAADAGHDPR